MARATKLSSSLSGIFDVFRRSVPQVIFFMVSHLGFACSVLEAQLEPLLEPSLLQHRMNESHAMSLRCEQATVDATNLPIPRMKVRRSCIGFLLSIFRSFSLLLVIC